MVGVATEVVATRSVGLLMVIAGVMPGGPAALAGLKAGDVLLQVNEQRISDRGQLYSLLWEHRPGGEIEFKVYRDEAIRSFTITTGNAEEFFA